MSNVFVTRQIPDNGPAMLRAAGHTVDINPHDRPLTAEELLSALRAKPYDAVISLLNDRIDAALYDAAPTVKIFANYTIGFDNFDIEEGRRRGVYLSNVPGGGADRVAEHAWALLLNLSCRVLEGDAYMRAGRYQGWDPMLLPGHKFAGRTLGLIGVGHIGSQVARIAARGFGMRVAYYDLVRNQDLERLHDATYYATVDEVLKQADAVSIHVPLTPETEHLFDARRLRLMKPTAYLINTSRGPVIDERALVEALKEGVIAGAGLDVFENEPTLTPGLTSLSNVVITPHIASSTMEARAEMSLIAAENVLDVLAGSPPRNLIYKIS